jgi:CheY-like chemotaxis protein
MKKTIWVIDDDPIYKIVINKIIARAEIFNSVSTFSNGKEAIDALKEALNNNYSLPDIILLDIEMPVMDGWGFMEEIGILNPQIIEGISIYISSSSIAFEDKQRAKNNSKISRYFSKPIKTNDLIEIASEIKKSNMINL